MHGHGLRFFTLIVVVSLLGIATTTGLGTAAQDDDKNAPKLGATVQDDDEPDVDDVVNVELIVDVSGSMAQTLATGETRMEAAQRVLADVIAGIPEREGVNVGLRIYGHQGDNTEAGQAESCQSSELVAAIRPVDEARKRRFQDRIDDLQPVG